MTPNEIVAVFSDHHKRNPLIWEYFEKFSLEILRSGRDYYSAQAVYNRIRWHVDIETDDGADFRMKSGHIAYYSRMFHVAHPEHDGFFRTCQLRSIDPLRDVEDDDGIFMGERMEEDETEVLAMLEEVYETGGTITIVEDDCF